MLQSTESSPPKTNQLSFLFRLSSSRMSNTPERHLFLQGGNATGDSGLVLSTDAKPRLKWTPDLQTVLEKAQDTLERQNLGTVGLEAEKVQLSELVSKGSTKCLNSAFSGMKDVSGFSPQQTQSNQPTDCSLDSSLTSVGGSRRDHETEFRWCKDLKENRKFLSPIVNDLKKAFDVEVHASDLSMSVGVQGGNWNGNSSYTEKVFKERNADANFLDQTTKRTDSIKPENEDIIQGFQLSCFVPKLDLNIHDGNDAASRCKQFDLNGFSWC